MEKKYLSLPIIKRKQLSNNYNYERWIYENHS